MNLLSVKNDIINFKSRKTIPNAPSNTLSFTDQGLKLSVLNSDQIAFKGYNNCDSLKGTQSEKYGWGPNADLHYVTSFFRNINTLKFVCDEVQKRFPKGTEIWDYACCYGEEPLSLAMLLNPDPNKIDKKYSIKAFDLSEKVIDIAKQGVFTIFDKEEDIAKDGFLLKKDSELSPEELKLKKLFEKYFKVKEVNDSIKPGIMDTYVELQNKSIFKDVLEFYGGDEVGNIVNIGNKEVKKEDKPGIIIAKNIWYHLTGNSIEQNNCTINSDDDTQVISYKTKTVDQLNFELLEQAIKGISEKIQDNGLLVVGNICFDHLFYKDPNNEELVEPSPFHELLKKYHFRPVNWEPTGGVEFLENKNIMVPSVWEKIPEGN